MKLSMSASSVKSASIPQDLVSAAIEANTARDEFLQCGLECKELEVCIENLNFVQSVIESNGLEGLRSIDIDGSIESFLGGLTTVEAATEGLIQSAKEMLKNAIDKIIEWWNRFWNWIKSFFKKEVSDQKIKVVENKIKDIKLLELKPDTSTEGLKVQKVFTLPMINDQIDTIDTLIAVMKKAFDKELIDSYNKGIYHGLADPEFVKHTIDDIRDSVKKDPSAASHDDAFEYVAECRNELEKLTDMVNKADEQITGIFRHEEHPVARTLTSMGLDKDPVKKLNYIITNCKIQADIKANMLKKLEKANANVEWLKRSIEQIGGNAFTNHTIIRSTIIVARKSIQLYSRAAMIMERGFNGCLNTADHLCNIIQRFST